MLAGVALKAVLPLAAKVSPVLLSGIDGRVLAFSIVMAVLTSVLFSLAPAFQAAEGSAAGL